MEAVEFKLQKRVFDKAVLHATVTENVFRSDCVSIFGIFA